MSDSCARKLTRSTGRVVLSLFATFAPACSRKTPAPSAAQQPPIEVSQDRVAVPGTRASLVPPPKFHLQPDEQAFAHETYFSKLMALEIPQPFAELAKTMTADGYAANGFTLLSSEVATVAGLRGLLCHTTKTESGVEMLSWMAAAGDDRESLLVIAAYPADLEQELGSVLRASVLSARWRVNWTSGRL